MKRAKYTESNCPKGIVIRVWHHNNPPGPTRWATRCALFYTEDTDFDYPILETWAHCHNKDQPNRRIGRKIAVGRALKMFDELRKDGLA